MGLPRKIGMGIYTQVQQPYQGGPQSFGGVDWNRVAWVRVRTTRLWGAPLCHVVQAAGETLPGRKGEKGLLLVGHENVPHGSGLTGDCCGNSADGA